jgi:polynucleotide 5'-hydroxyl-kinase GRC3/NOL9
VTDPAHRRLLEILRADPAAGWIYVVGATDTGKSTLARQFAEGLREEGVAGLVDCDPGQPTVGPPGTVGLVRVPGGQEPPWLRFIGSNTPAGHGLPLLAGIRRLADEAEVEGLSPVVFDTAGVLEGEAALELHLHLVDILDPDHLVAIEREREADALARALAGRERPTLHRIRPAESALRRSREARRRYRQGRFFRYFAGASVRALRIDRLGLQGKLPDPGDPEGHAGQLMALCDEHGFVVSLGLLVHLDYPAGCLHVLAPWFDASQVRTLRFGSLRVEPGGREIGMVPAARRFAPLDWHPAPPH